MRKSTVVGMSLLLGGMCLFSSCTDEIIIRNVCDESLANIEADGEFVGSLLPGGEAKADVSSRSRVVLTWQYQGSSYSETLRRGSVHDGAVYELDCTWGGWY